MSKNMKRIFTLISLSCILLINYDVHAQGGATVTLNGATYACTGVAQNFLVSVSGSSYSPNWYEWSVTGGTFSNGTTTQSGSSATAAVTWTGTGGTVSVGVLYKGSSQSDIHFIGNASKSVTVSDPAEITVAGPSVICASSTSATFSVTLDNAVSASVTYQWFKGGIQQSQGPSTQFTTTIAEGTTIYCKAISSDWCGPGTITSNTFTVHLTPMVTPVIPIIPSATEFCTGGSINFTIASNPYVTGATQWNWKLNAQTLSVVDHMQLSVTTDSSIPNAYDVGDAVTLDLSNLSGTCLNATYTFSQLSAPTMHIVPQPTLPTIDAGGTCSGQTISFTATPGSNAQTTRWYDQLTGGPVLATATDFSSSETTRTNPYYITSYNSQNQCESARMAVITLPAASMQGATTFCPGNINLLVTGNGVTGATYSWTAQASANIGGASGGSGSGITNQLTNLSANTGTVDYTITPYAKGCTGIPVNTSITIKPEPAIVALDAEIFTGQTTSIAMTTANNLSGTSFSWTATSQNVKGIATGTGNPIAQRLVNVTDTDQTATYTISASADGCAATQPKTITVLVKQLSTGPAYVSIHTAQVDLITDPVAISTQTVDRVNHTTIYYDGLDRKLQTVVLQGSPDHLDLVKPQAYDETGRESHTYLPFVAGSDGLYKENIIDPDTKEFIGAARDFYTIGENVPHDTKPFSTIEFEPSPLNRPLKQGAPGESWQPDNDPYSLNDKTIKKRFDLNTADDQILQFIYEPVADQLSVRDATGFIFYDADELHANRTIDGNNNDVIEYIDRQGRTICKKVQHGVDGATKLYASTYYIYDDKDKLILVLPPEAIVEILKQQP
jgi:hypothetical protein